MRNVTLGVILLAAAAACSNTTSGAATFALSNSVPTAPTETLQFGEIGSTLGYSGQWLVSLPDSGILDAGPALSIEFITSGPGAGCYAPFTGEAPYVEDAGNGNTSIIVTPGQWSMWINIDGISSTGLTATSIPLGPNVPPNGGSPIIEGIGAVVGTKQPLGATWSVQQIDGSELVSTSGTVVLSSASSGSVTGTITGFANNPAVNAAAQPADISAVFNSIFADPQLFADADAGAPQATLYTDALNDALDGGFDAGALAAALLADPDAGGTFTLKGTFTAPICNPISIPAP